MKWTTLEWIKAHSRVEYDIEDDLLTLYANSAEETILNITGRTEEELKSMNKTDSSKVPDAILHATLMLVDLSYQQRSPLTPQQLYAVPYTFDILVKPYMIL
jgi:uncharacterized phage protein (predicted DNA packaging)